MFAAFVSQVHLGPVEVEGIGAVQSHYSAGELNACRPIARCDGRANRRSRSGGCRKKINISMKGCGTSGGGMRGGGRAWHENLILERFFAPVLDMPTYASPNGNRWPPEQRANVAAPIGTARPSSAGPSRIRWWRGQSDLLDDGALVAGMCIADAAWRP